MSVATRNILKGKSLDNEAIVPNEMKSVEDMRKGKGPKFLEPEPPFHSLFLEGHFCHFTFLDKNAHKYAMNRLLSG